MNLLLIRGLSREMRHWGDFASSLESSITGLNVHRLEMPGAGTKMNVSAPLTIRGYEGQCKSQVPESHVTEMSQGLVQN